MDTPAGWSPTHVRNVFFNCIEDEMEAVPNFKIGNTDMVSLILTILH